MRQLLLIAVLVAGCRGSATSQRAVFTKPDAGPTVTDAGADLGPPAPTGPPRVVVGAWNLHNFSKYGTAETRVAAIASEIAALDVDALGVEELKLLNDTDATGPQAWDALLEALPGFGGVHAPWSTFGDTTVGLIYREATTTVIASETLFIGDTQPFPRPPLRVDLTVTKEGRTSTFAVIVLHLKAFQDSVDRRREACQKLRDYVQAQAEKRFVLIGDLNDDPYDLPSENSFDKTFLGAEPDYVFVTASLPPETVTSTGYFHKVGGQTYTGEFLDHAIVTGDLYDDFQTVAPLVVAKPEAEFDAWTAATSDHFPLIVTFQPAAPGP